MKNRFGKNGALDAFYRMTKKYFTSVRPCFVHLTSWRHRDTLSYLEVNFYQGITNPSFQCFFFYIKPSSVNIVMKLSHT